MGTLLVIIGLSIWTVITAAAAITPMFLGVGKSVPTIAAVTQEASGPKAPTSPAPVRLRSDDRIAA